MLTAFLAPAAWPTRSQRVPRVCRCGGVAMVAKGADVAALTLRLRSALQGLDRGLAIDADDDTMGSEEAEVEDLIENIETLNTSLTPVGDPRMAGEWDLAYTSSSITRFFGGVTGLQRLLPEGEVGRIVQYISAEDGISEFHETIYYELPIIGKPAEVTTVSMGKIRRSSKTRQLWEPEHVKFFGFKKFAEGWKTLRAFQVADTTYLDDDVRVTRGQTGSVAVYFRPRVDNV